MYKHCRNILIFYSENQYKKQIAKWGQDKKRVKSKEYLAILKHKRSIRRGETGKHVDYFLNGKRVPASDIVRFEKRMLKQKKISERDTFSDIGKSKYECLF
jgi:hypothetical protein